MSHSPNTELAYRVLDAVSAHSEHFDMGRWRDAGGEELVGIEQLTSPACGTTACFAGWAAVMSGYQINRLGDVVNRNGETAGHVSDVARRVLGLDFETADKLFYSSEYFIEDEVAEIFGPRPNGQGEAR